MPTCPKCGKFISEGHYERHLKRCGTPHEEEPQLTDQSVTARLERAERGTGVVAPEEGEGGRNWKKILVAGFVIFLLIGSLVVFFIIYGLSLL